MTIAETFGGSGAPVIESHDFRGYKLCVETETENKGGGRCRDQPQTVHRFATSGGDGPDRDGGEHADKSPNERSEMASHREIRI